MNPTHPTRTARRMTGLAAAFLTALMLVGTASAQVPLPVGASDLPALPDQSVGHAVPGASASAATGGHAARACADLDPDAAARLAASQLPGEAQAALGQAQGAAATAAAATSAVPMPPMPAVDCAGADLDRPEAAVGGAAATASGSAGGIAGWFQGVLGSIRGLF